MDGALDLDELVEHWTLLDDERELIVGTRGPTSLGFAVLLKLPQQGNNLVDQLVGGWDHCRRREK